MWFKVTGLVVVVNVMKVTGLVCVVNDVSRIRGCCLFTGILVFMWYLVE